MANVERHEFFPTCIYRFKHDFKENELNNVVNTLRITVYQNRMDSNKRDRKSNTKRVT